MACGAMKLSKKKFEALTEKLRLAQILVEHCGEESRTATAASMDANKAWCDARHELLEYLSSVCGMRVT